MQLRAPVFHGFLEARPSSPEHRAGKTVTSKDPLLEPHRPLSIRTTEKTEALWVGPNKRRKGHRNACNVSSDMILCLAMYAKEV